MQKKEIPAENYLKNRLEYITGLKEKMETKQEVLVEFNKEEEEIREALLSLAEQQKSLQSCKKNKENYCIKILEQQENERQRIARELHDTTVQVLTNLVHKTELCSKVMDTDMIRAKLELEIMNNTIRYTINEMRNIIHDLRPMAFDDFGLITTIERMVSQLNAESEMHFQFRVEGENDNLPPVISLTLVRIVQEACNNAVKHSEAENVYIKFSFYESLVEVSIKDDGRGFNLKAAEEKRGKVNQGFGLSIMKERISLLSGEYKITTGANKGTHILVVVPVE